MSDITQILNEINAGQSQKAAQLMPLVYDELRMLAAARLAAEYPGQTLSATALVHEAYIRLVDNYSFENRRHFFAAAAEAMRRILIDQARRKAADKHGGQRVRCDLERIEVMAPRPDDDLIAVDEALARFEVIDSAKATLVKLRYFAGMTIPEAAEALGISTNTADRHWAYARAWLHAELRKGDSRN